MLRRRKDSIDPDKLMELSDASPIKTWVNLLLLHMYRDSLSTLTLQKSKGIPSIPLEEEVPPGELDFDRIINRLKVMSGLDPVVFKEPRQGEISLTIHGTGYTVSTTFVDSGTNPRCELTVRKEQ